MKKIFFALVVIFGLWSCVREELPSYTATEGATFDLEFSVVLPEMHTATRAMGDEVINTLHLYIFDENGYISQFKEATITQVEEGSNSTWEDGVLTTFRVTDIYASQFKRTIHFIANLPDNAKTSFGSEQELINSMYTSGGVEAFWQYRVFENGLNSETSILNVALVRNYAMVSIDNKDTNFGSAMLALVNTPDCGTVAPYSISRQLYAPYPITVADGKTAYQTITDWGYYGHELANMTLQNTLDNFNPTFSSDPVCLYERMHLGSNKPTFAVISGTYQGGTYYYRVDLVDAENKYLNILRNFEYKIVINEVLSAGYTTALEAASKAASNNVSFSVETKDLTSITDGNSALYVSAVQIIHNDASKAIELKYKYVPDIKYKDTIENDYGTGNPVSIAVKDSNTPVVARYSVASEDVDGWRTISFTTTAMGTEAKDQNVVISAGDLAREVQLILTPSYKLQNLAVANVVGSVVNSDVDLAITLPTNLYPGMFPLTFNIVSDKLTPNTKRNTLPIVNFLNASGVPDSKGQYYGFEATIEWEDYAIYSASGNISGYNQTFTFYFLTNTANSASTVSVYNKYFGSRGVAFTYGSVPVFQLNAINNTTNSVKLILPTGLNFGNTDQQVTLTYYPVDAVITAATNGAVVSNGTLTIPYAVYDDGTYNFDLTFNCPNGATYLTVSHPGMKSATIQIQ